MITKAYRLITFQGRAVLFCLLCDRYTITPAHIDQHVCAFCDLDLDEVPRDFDPEAEAPEVHVEPLSTLLPWAEQRIHTPLLTSQGPLGPPRQEG